VLARGDADDFQRVEDLVVPGLFYIMLTVFLSAAPRFATLFGALWYGCTAAVLMWLRGEEVLQEPHPPPP